MLHTAAIYLLNPTPEQEQTLRDYCEQHELSVSQMFTDIGDNTTMERPGLQGLLTVVKASGVDWVVTPALEQFGTTQIWSEQIQPIFTQFNIQTSYVKDAIPFLST